MKISVKSIPGLRLKSRVISLAFFLVIAPFDLYLFINTMRQSIIFFSFGCSTNSQTSFSSIDLTLLIIANNHSSASFLYMASFMEISIVYPDILSELVVLSKYNFRGLPLAPILIIRERPHPLFDIGFVSFRCY